MKALSAFFDMKPGLSSGVKSLGWAKDRIELYLAANDAFGDN
jgi:hypothetical protein